MLLCISTLWFNLCSYFTESPAGGNFLWNLTFPDNLILLHANSGYGFKMYTSSNDRGRMTHICINKLGHNWVTGAKPLPNNDLLSIVILLQISGKFQLKKSFEMRLKMPCATGNHFFVAYMDQGTAELQEQFVCQNTISCVLGQNVTKTMKTVLTGHGKT